MIGMKKEDLQKVVRSISLKIMGRSQIVLSWKKRDKYKYDFNALNDKEDSIGLDLALKLFATLDQDLTQACQDPESFKKVCNFKKGPLPFFKPR